MLPSSSAHGKSRRGLRCRQDVRATLLIFIYYVDSSSLVDISPFGVNCYLTGIKVLNL